MTSARASLGEESLATTNRVFNAFNRHVDSTHRWLANRVRPALGFSKEVLLDRLVQCVVDLSLASYARQAHAHRASGRSTLPPGTILSCGRAKSVVGTGRLDLSLTAAIGMSAAFILHWVYGLVAIVSGVAGRGRGGAAVLLHDLSETDILAAGSEAPFVAFCRQGPIDPLRNATWLLVAGSQGGPSSDPAIQYCRHPLIALVKDARLGVAGRARLIARHVAVGAGYFPALLRMPQLGLIGRELAYAAIARELDRRGAIAAVIHTCSSYRQQPVWARGLSTARTHMIWYAQNWRPLQRVDGDEASQYPSLRWIRADEHWVWTSSFAAYLGALVPGILHVVGPILFRLPARLPMSIDPLIVLVFDVPAVSDAIMLDPNGEIDNYFHPDYLCTFVQEIVSLKAPLERRLGRRVSIRLKMKRGFQPDYARAYYDFVDEAASRGDLELAAPRDNLFELVSEAAVAISYPFTSAAYVAESLRVPSLFCDPTGALVAQDFSATGALPFARRRDDLLDHLTAALSTRAIDGALA